MTGYHEFQQHTHAYNPWIGAKCPHDQESAADREWKRLEAKGVVDKFRRVIPKVKPGEGKAHTYQYPLGEGRKWPRERRVPDARARARSTRFPPAQAARLPVRLRLRGPRREAPGLWQVDRARTPRARPP
jgi:hypothetical protein